MNEKELHDEIDRLKEELAKMTSDRDQMKRAADECAAKLTEGRSREIDPLVQQITELQAENLGLKTKLGDVQPIIDKLTAARTQMERGCNDTDAIIALLQEK